MALDSRAQLHSHNNTSFYVFCGSSSSSDHLQTEGGLSSAQVGFHRLSKGNNNNKYFKLEQLAAGHMMHGGIGTLLCDSNDGSFVSFEDSYEAAAGAQGYEHNSNMIHAECFSNSHHPAVTSLNNLIVAEDGRSHLTGKVNNRDDSLDYWFHSSDAADNHIALHKHPTLDESCMPPNKKQCTSSATTKKSSKTKQSLVSKDPQCTAAKNRRERISERLKILQELVPNGSKVDMVTMLEKAIGYVKFLQLQVKVLAADEFWPLQGGKAPELSQVKDAIDAILSSQRSDRNSTSD